MESIESETSDDSFTQKSQLVQYGPIKVRHRLMPSQTLLKGRRTTEQKATEEDPIKREQRLNKNRLASRNLKKSRDEVEIRLSLQVAELERKAAELEKETKELEERKAKLNRDVYNARQAPFVPLIVDLGIPIIYRPKERPDLEIDLTDLLKVVVDHRYSLL